MTSQILPTSKPLPSRASQLIRLATDHGGMSKTAALLTTTSVQFLRSSRKVWLLHQPKISLTLATTPLGHHTTGSTNMMMEPRKAHQTSQRPILYLNRWTRTVEGATKTPLSLEETCNWFSESKRSRRLLRLPGSHVLTVTLLGHRTLQPIRNMTKAELVTAD